MRDHTTLQAFHEADELAVLIYRVTKSFPREEQFGLTSQMRRAAVSVPSNIVEGCARQGQADFVRFLDTAFASLRELHYQVSLSHRLGYLDQAAFTTLDAQCVRVSKLLAGLIRSMRSRRSSTTPLDQQTNRPID
jgi:four helix bundle protein